MIDDLGNFYDILEIQADASTKEIHEAYVRLKSAYKKDSLAMYTLMSKEEAQETIKKIEEAYKVLSDENKRESYDLNFKIEDDITFPFDQIISIDRVPPMETPGEDILIAPSTDFAIPGDLKTVSKDKPRQKSSLGGIESEIEQETEWRGSFIKKVRESKGVSIEDVSEFTKITKRYISAIENEDFDKLPATAYLRGFVLQIAKQLKLPYEKVANTYIQRVKAKKTDK
jgi:curved DNA-binding protein CbpA